MFTKEGAPRSLHLIIWPNDLFPAEGGKEGRKEGRPCRLKSVKGSLMWTALRRALPAPARPWPPPLRPAECGRARDEKEEEEEA